MKHGKFEVIKQEMARVNIDILMFMNQGKLEVVKQEMARVNINILEISELKWMRMSEFNSMTILSTTVGKNPLEETE